MDIKLEGNVRRFVEDQVGDRQVRMTHVESMAVAQVEPARAVLAAAGRRFHGGNQIIANGIAPVAAIPTTTATLLLYNREPDNGLSMFVDKLNFWLGSGTAAAGATLFVTISPAKIASPPTANATGYGSASSAGSTRATKALWTTAATIAAGAAWVAAQSTFQLAAANVGQGDGGSDLDGGMEIRPGYGMGFAILSGAGTSPLYGISASWSEYFASNE